MPPILSSPNPTLPPLLTGFIPVTKCGMNLLKSFHNDFFQTCLSELSVCWEADKNTEGINSRNCLNKPKQIGNSNLTTRMQLHASNHLKYLQRTRIAFLS